MEINSTIMYIFEVVINVFQSYVFYIFLSKCLGKKNNIPMPYVLMPLAIFLYLQVQTFITDFESYGGLIYILYLVVLCNVFLEGNMITKCVYCVISYTLVMFSSIIGAGIVSLNSNKTFLNLTMDSTLDRIIAALLIQVIWIFFLILVIKAQETDFVMNNTAYTYIAMAIPVFSIIICTIIITNMQNSGANFVMSILSVAGVMLLNAVDFYLLITLNGVYKKKMKAEMENSIYENQWREMQKMQESFERADKMRHEVKHILQSVSIMAKNGEIDKLTSYLDKMDINKELPMLKKTFSENIIINYLFNNLENTCEKMNIDFACFMMGKFDGIGDFDIQSLFGNLFDNALEAINESEKKHLYVEVVCNDESVSIVVANSTNGNVLLENKEMKTTKSDKLIHGYGVKIIKDVVKKYCGTIEYKYIDPDYVKCSIILIKECAIEKE